MIADPTLYELTNKHDTLEESPSGRLLLDDEPLQVGEEIEIAATLGRWVRVRVCHDEHGWYGVTMPGPGKRAQQLALLPRTGVRRTSTPKLAPEWRGHREGWTLIVRPAFLDIMPVWLWRAFDVGGRVGCSGTARSFDEAQKAAEDFARRNLA